MTWKTALKGNMNKGQAEQFYETGEVHEKIYSSVRTGFLF